MYDVPFLLALLAVAGLIGWRFPSIDLPGAD